MHFIRAKYFYLVKKCWEANISQIVTSGRTFVGISVYVYVCACVCVFVQINRELDTRWTKQVL